MTDKLTVTREPADGPETVLFGAAVVLALGWGGLAIAMAAWGEWAAAVVVAAPGVVFVVAVVALLSGARR